MTTTLTDEPKSKESYIQDNRDMFNRRGEIQWGIRCLEQRAAADLTRSQRAELAELRQQRIDLVIESLSRFDDPADQLASFEAQCAKVAAIDPDCTSAAAKARAWFDTHKFERTCDRAGRAEIVADRYTALMERINAIVLYTDDTMPVLNKRQLRRLRRQLDDVTEEIVRVNTKLLKSYSKSFTRSAGHHDAEDYEAAGMYGLMRAVTTFDPAAGRFDVWAWKHIQREVLHTFRAAEYGSMNHSDFERRPRVLRAVAALQARNTGGSKNASYEEIATEAGLTVDQVKRVLDAPRVDSLYARVGDDGETELGDLIPADDYDVEGSVVTSTTLSAIEKYGLAVLDARELLVITRRLGLDDEPEQRLAAIGQMLGRSREGIRQAEARALAKLRHPVVMRRIVREGRQ